MEFQSKNYVTWDQYAQMHPEIGDIEAAKKIQSYEDQIFSL
jgi:hypothetical protein